MSSLLTEFYVTGGTLRRDAACYVVRWADHELHAGLGPSMNFTRYVRREALG